VLLKRPDGLVTQAFERRTLAWKLSAQSISTDNRPCDSPEINPSYCMELLQWSIALAARLGMRCQHKLSDPNHPQCIELD
jgi:hypothetical protein